MVNLKSLLFIPFFFLVNYTVLLSQGPISGFMPGGATTDVAFSYSNESYNSYFFGKEEQNISNEVSSISLFLEHGINDSFSLVLTVPYLWIDEVNKGIQDGIVAIKYRNQYKRFRASSLSMITSVGVSFPMSGYPRATDNPIGIRATTFQGRFQIQHQFDFGFFYNIQSGIDFRLIPSALSSVPVLFRAGFGGKHFYVDGWLELFNTFNAGVDTQLLDGSGSNWAKVGGTFFYPVTSSFGLFIGGAYLLSGTNIGKAVRFNTGFTYKIKW